jgi:hypothetical protein
MFLDPRYQAETLKEKWLKWINEQLEKKGFFVLPYFYTVEKKEILFICKDGFLFVGAVGLLSQMKNFEGGLK